MEKPEHKNISSYLEVCYILRIYFNAELGSAERGSSLVAVQALVSSALWRTVPH